MSSRKDIEWRLGHFARASTFDNCGIGPNGFEPGNNCGKQEGGGGSAPSKPSERVKGIEDRAKESGKSFTDQWLQESRASIDKRYKDAERRRNRSAERKQAKAEAKVKEIEKRLADLKAQGPQSSPRSAELDRRIAETDVNLSEVTKQREAELAAATARQAEAKKTADEARARSEKRKQEVLKKWTKMFGPKKAEEMLAKVAKQVERESARGK